MYYDGRKIWTIPKKCRNFFINIILMCLLYWSVKNRTFFNINKLLFKATAMLAVKQKRRIYDITNVLEGIGLIEKKTKNQVRWR